jgi:hypothetical protein
LLEDPSKDELRSLSQSVGRTSCATATKCIQHQTKKICLVTVPVRLEHIYNIL